MLDVSRYSECLENKKKVSNLRLQEGPGTRSFRPIVLSNRFKRLASIAMTVRLPGLLHYKIGLFTRTKNELGESHFPGHYQSNVIPAVKSTM